MSQTSRRPNPVRQRQSALAALLVALSFVAVAAGVGILFGLGWALVAAGILGAAYGLLLVDVDEKAR